MTDRRTSRRAFLAALALPGLPVVGCDSSSSKGGFFGLMERWNERFQRALLDPSRLAPELSKQDETPLEQFPPYYISDEVPRAPAGWALRVGGRVARPGTFSAAALERLTRTDVRVRHYCVEGWSAVASWHGVRLRDLAEAGGAGPAPPYALFPS